uniref:Uncharacterized protein n=1 Tax=Amphimedon queenslandica TaxID=400682 RepID=A0A1X7T3V9_AMPQE
LRENLERLRVSSKPYLDLLDTLIAIKNWKNPSLTLVIFLMYMYCVWNGWLLQCLLLLSIIYLSLNYLRTTGLTEQFGFGSHPARGSEDDTSETLRDKFQLMKHIGQRVQNTSQTVSDNLEKGQNLLEWYQPQSTRKVYTMLCGAFIATLFIPNDYSMTIAGLGIGFKLFIIDNIYRKYPIVKKKYDGLARMWKSLPTHKDVILLQSLTEDEIVSVAALLKDHARPRGAIPATLLSACDEKTEDTLSTLEKVWDEADKVVYEQQMEHLHDQLTAALIDNQELKMKLKSIESREAKSQEAKTK